VIGGLVRILGVIGCLIAAALAGLAGWAGAGAQDGSSAAVFEATGYSAALYDQLERARRGEPAVVTDVDAAAALLLRRAPLHVAPLALRGLVSAGAGDSAGADRAFAATFARNPRNVLARLWLVNRALEARDIDRAMDMVSGLFALAPENNAAYVETLVSVAALPGGFAGIEQRLGPQGEAPSWAGAVVSRLNAVSPDLDQLIALNRITPSTQQAFITRMIAERGVEAGFRAWQAFVPTGAEAAFSWPYDGAFEGRQGPPPFNWQPYGDLVEFARSGGLNVSYLGRGQPVIIEQLMLLAPGAYTFTAMLSGESNAAGGGLGWVITCSASAKEIGRVLIRELSSSSSRESFGFVVPDSDCPAQRLVLRGEPGEFPTRARAEIASVAITPTSDGR